MEQAIKELQIAEAKVDHLRTAVNEAQKHLNQLRNKLHGANSEVGEKQYLVLLSARHSFIPPTSSPAT
jgi:exonuclease VII small subunit